MEDAAPSRKGPSRTFELHFDFAGYKHLTTEATTTKTGEPQLSAIFAANFHFDYSTIYPHSLQSKILLIKCFKKRWYRKKLLATAQLSLHMLATGPSSYRLLLENKKKKQQQLTLHFICKFVQHCPLFSCVLGGAGNLGSLANLGSEERVTLAKDVDELDRHTIQYGEHSFPLLTDYNPNDQDKYLPITTLPRIVRCISHGPIYHQMSESSVGTEQGVAYGQITRHYPIPNKWAKDAVVGFVQRPFPVQMSDVLPWDDMETLIFLDYHKSVQACCQGRSTKNLCDAIFLELKTRYRNILRRVKMRYLLPL